MHLLRAILGRRSVRRYRRKSVEREKILELLKAATWAPSAGNKQSWRFFVMDDDDIKTEVSRACHNASQVRGASHLVLVAFDKDVMRRTYGRRGVEIYGIQETAAAIQNLMLRAYELGLGTCWIGDLDEDKLRDLFGLERNLKLVAVVTVGYPDESPESDRRPWKEVTHFVEKE